MFSTILLFIIILSVIVFVHEWGHFYTARKTGMKVEEFAIGFPPRIWAWKGKDGVVYSVNWIPLGGFVKIKGESYKDDGASDPDSMAMKKPWQRFVVLIAGVTMNFLLCAVVLSAGYVVGLPQAIEGNMANAQVRDHKVQIIGVSDGSPASEAELMLGDVIRDINGQSIASDEEVIKVISGTAEGAVLTLGIDRAGTAQSITVTPRPLASTNGKPGIGIGVVETGIVSYPWYVAAYKGVETTVYLAGSIFRAFYTMIASIIIGNGSSVNVSGPVGIAVMTGQIAQLGVVYVLQFMALLSINLAVLNILPLPALDGGRILFVIIEKIRRKPINQRIEGIVHAAGMTALLALVTVITVFDVAHNVDAMKRWWGGLFG